MSAAILDHLDAEISRIQEDWLCAGQEIEEEARAAKAAGAGSARAVALWDRFKANNDLAVDRTVDLFSATFGPLARDRHGRRLLKRKIEKARFALRQHMRKHVMPADASEIETGLVKGEAMHADFASLIANALKD